GEFRKQHRAEHDHPRHETRGEESEQDNEEAADQGHTGILSLSTRGAKFSVVMPGLAAFAKASAGRAHSWPRRSLGGDGSRASTPLLPHERTTWMAGSGPAMTKDSASASITAVAPSTCR